MTQSDGANDADGDAQARVRARGRPRDSWKNFSAGFQERLEKATNKQAKFGTKGRSQICELDHSQLSKEDALEFAKIMFELYYTDKTVKKLTFEKNCARMVAGYCSK